MEAQPNEFLRKACDTTFTAQTCFQCDLLCVIAGKDEPYAFAITEELESYDNKETHHGRLYLNLDTLVDRGFVEKGQRDRRTNYYEITGRAQREIDARRDWEREYVTSEAADQIAIE